MYVIILTRHSSSFAHINHLFSKCYLHMINHDLYNSCLTCIYLDYSILILFLSHGRHSHSIFLSSKKNKQFAPEKQTPIETIIEKTKSLLPMTLKYLIYTSVIYIHESNNNVCYIYNE